MSNPSEQTVKDAAYFYRRAQAEIVVKLIHAELDGTTWDADTPAIIAEILRAAGYEVREVLSE